MGLVLQRRINYSLQTLIKLSCIDILYLDQAIQDCASKDYLNIILQQLKYMRNQHNIGETGKTSVKVSGNPGGQSNWSFGWSQPQKPKQSNIIKYHNESNIAFGETTQADLNEKKRIEEEEAKKKEDLNKNLPSYDPKAGGKASIFFGDEKTDYRKKDEVFTSVKVKNPPGGKSSIQFG